MLKAKKVVFMSMLVMALILISSTLCFAGDAEDPTEIDVTGVFDTVTSSVSDAVIGVLPYAAVILGAMLAIAVGMKIYKRVVGR